MSVSSNLTVQENTLGALPKCSQAESSISDMANSLLNTLFDSVDLVLPSADGVVDTLNGVVRAPYTLSKWIYNYVFNSPPVLPVESTFTEEENTGWEKTSRTVEQLWNNRESAKEFRKVWDTASIKDKRDFTYLLDQDSSKESLKIRDAISKIIYKSSSNSQTKIQWPSQEGQAAYYHATSLNGLEGILKSGRIKVRHEQAYKGAFVSTRPELSFGNYVR